MDERKVWGGHELMHNVTHRTSARIRVGEQLRGSASVGWVWRYACGKAGAIVVRAVIKPAQESLRGGEEGVGGSGRE